MDFYMNFFLNYKFFKIFVTKTLGLDPDLGKWRNPDPDSVNLVYKQCFFVFMDGSSVLTWLPC